MSGTVDPGSGTGGGSRCRGVHSAPARELALESRSWQRRAAVTHPVIGAFTVAAGADERCHAERLARIACYGAERSRRVWRELELHELANKWWFTTN